MVFVMRALPLVTNMVVKGLGWQERGVPGQVEGGGRNVGAGGEVVMAVVRNLESVSGEVDHV